MQNVAGQLAVTTFELIEREKKTAALSELRGLELILL
jgi:hypothetical protein